MTQPNSPFPGAHTLLLNFVKKAAVEGEGGWKDTEPRQANTRL